MIVLGVEVGGYLSELIVLARLNRVLTQTKWCDDWETTRALSDSTLRRQEGGNACIL